MTLKEVKDNNEETIKDILASLKIEDFYSSIHKLTPPKIPKSMRERFETYEEVEEQEKVITPFVLEEEKPKEFQNKEEYFKWRDMMIEGLEKQIKFKLNPRDFYLTQATGKIKKVINRT